MHVIGMLQLVVRYLGRTTVLFRFKVASALLQVFETKLHSKQMFIKLWELAKTGKEFQTGF